MNLFAQERRDIELRPHQVTAVEGLREGIRKGLRRQILVAPCSFGKTECAAHIIQKGLEKGSSAWFIVDRVNLVDQTSARFASYGIDHGVIQGDNFYTDYSKPVQVVSAQTLEKRSIDWRPDFFIVDEAHDRRSGVMKFIEESEKSKAIGLTATPFAAGMANDWDGFVNGATVNQLLRDGYLAPLKIKACVSPDMVGAKKKSDGEWEGEDVGQRGITIIGDVVKTWVEQTRKEFGGPVPTIVFTPSVKHGAELCRQFADAGFNFQQLSYLDGGTDSRRAIIEEFRRPGSSIDGLVSCGVLTKGSDFPFVRCAISCKPYRKAFSSHIQELGRLMRTHPGKDYGLWLCHSGNCISFAEDTAFLFEHGVQSLSDATRYDSVAREPTEKVRKERFCGECGSQLEPGEFSCSSCGWERPARGEIQVKEGTLIDFDINMSSRFEPRSNLRAECLKDPRRVWNACISYTSQASSKGPDHARKWGIGIWFGIYPAAKPPRGFFDLPANPGDVRPDELSLIEREIRRFRKQGKQRRAA